MAFAEEREIRTMDSVLENRVKSRKSVRERGESKCLPGGRYKVFGGRRGSGGRWCEGDLGLWLVQREIKWFLFVRVMESVKEAVQCVGAPGEHGGVGRPVRPG